MCHNYIFIKYLLHVYAFCPEYIISLEASDEFLLNTILSCPEYQIQGTHYDESGMIRRLSEFR